MKSISNSLRKQQYNLEMNENLISDSLINQEYSLKIYDNKIDLKKDESNKLRRDTFMFVGGVFVVLGTTISTICMISNQFYSYLRYIGLDIQKGEDQDAHPFVLFSTYVSMSVTSLTIIPKFLSKKPIIKLKSKTMQFTNIKDSILSNNKNSHEEHKNEEHIHSDWQFATKCMKQCNAGNISLGVMIYVLWASRAASIVILPIYSIQHINRFVHWEEDLYQMNWLIIISTCTLLIFPYAYKLFLDEKEEFLEKKESLIELIANTKSKLNLCLETSFFFILPIVSNLYSVIFEYFFEYQFLMQKFIASIDLHRGTSKKDLPSNILLTDFLSFAFAFNEIFRGVDCKEKIITTFYAFKETFEAVLLVPVQVGRVTLYCFLNHEKEDPSFTKECLYLMGSIINCFAKLSLFALCTFVAAMLNPRVLLGNKAADHMHSKHDIEIKPDKNLLGYKLEHLAHEHFHIASVLIRISEFYGILVSIGTVFNLYRIDFDKNLITKKIATAVNSLYNYIQGGNYDRNKDALDTCYKFIQLCIDKLFCKRGVENEDYDSLHNQSRLSNKYYKEIKEANNADIDNEEIESNDTQKEIDNEDIDNEEIESSDIKETKEANNEENTIYEEKGTDEEQGTDKEKETKEKITQPEAIYIEKDADAQDINADIQDITNDINIEDANVNIIG